MDHDCVYDRKSTQPYAGIFEQSKTYAQSWFQDKNTGKDFTEYRGLRLGHCLELLMFNFFQSMFTCTVNIEEYLKHEKPNLMVYVCSEDFSGPHVDPSLNFNPFRKLLPLLCQRNQVEFVDIPPVESEGKKPATNKSGFLEFFKPGPSLFVLGMEWRLPKPVYLTLKNGFLFFKNLVGKVRLGAQKANILFSSPTAVNYAGPHVVEAILRSGEFNLFVWKGESRQPEIINILPHLTWDYLPSQATLFSLRTKFRKQFKKDREKLKRSTEYQGMPFSEIFPSYFENLYRSYFPQLVVHANSMKAQLIKNKIRMVIVHSDHSTFERMTLLVAKGLSIPSIYFQHGIEPRLKHSKLGFPSDARYHFVWGKSNEKDRLHKGMDENHIKIVGCPLYKVSDDNREEQAPEINSSGTIVLIMHTAGQLRSDERTTYSDNELIVKLSLEMIKKFPAKKLIIKLRQNDKQADIYRQLISKAQVKNAEINDENIIPLLEQCDLFLFTGSTAALEAMLRNKPGVQLLFYFNEKSIYENDEIPYAGYGANMEVKNPVVEELVGAVNSIYRSNAVREKLRQGRIKFMQDFSNLGAGDPAENFIKALEECLSG
ncbi:MAG: hypothetical protein ACE5G9_10255 [Nitrospinales bacterium]